MYYGPAGKCDVFYVLHVHVHVRSLVRTQRATHYLFLYFKIKCLQFNSKFLTMTEKWVSSIQFNTSLSAKFLTRNWKTASIEFQNVKKVSFIQQNLSQKDCLLLFSYSACSCHTHSSNSIHSVVEPVVWVCATCTMINYVLLWSHWACLWGTRFQGTSIQDYFCYLANIVQHRNEPASWCTSKNCCFYQR